VTSAQARDKAFVREFSGDESSSTRIGGTNMTRCAFAVVFLASAPAVAHVQTLTQKQFTAKQDTEFAESSPNIDKVCGNAMKASIDWPRFLKSDISGNSVASYRAEPLKTMQSMSFDPFAKTSITEKIKIYTYGFGGSGKRALSLENGAPRMDVDWDAANYGDHL
jgi:hypothetical protein